MASPHTIPKDADGKLGLHRAADQSFVTSASTLHLPAASQQHLVSAPDASGYRDTALSSPAAPAKAHPAPRNKWALIAAAVVAAAAVVGLAVGLGVGLGGHHNNNTTSSSSSSASGHGKGSSHGLDSSGNDPNKITPLPFWDWADSSKKALGVSLGGWLVLERWINEDWFTRYAPDDYDEWHFTQTLGSKAAQVLSEHYDSWVSEDEIETLYQHGINNVRIPVGFWPFIPLADGEPYVNSTQLPHLTRMLGWLWKRQMYAVIDLHGMPGSQVRPLNILLPDRHRPTDMVLQSGDQSTGLNTSAPTWWTQENQNRSDATVQAAVDWLSYNPYKSVVSAITPVNEPNGPAYASKGDNMNVTEAFYERSYAALQKAGYSMFFHHGFASKPATYWAPFATGKNASMLVINDNPYPGWFPSVSNTTKIDQRVCNTVTDYNGFPVPMSKTEYSLISGVSDPSWPANYYSTQVSAYAASAGSFFWNFKMANSSTPVTALPNESQTLYSFLDQVQNGAIPAKDNNQSIQSYLASLPAPACGTLADTYSASSPASPSTGAAAATSSTNPPQRRMHHHHHPHVRRFHQL